MSKASTRHAAPGIDLDVAPSLREQLLDGALVCVARWGVTKTTLEDIGREASVSRATVYRMFPGGKAALLTEMVEREVLTTASFVTATMNAEDNLRDAVVAGITQLAIGIREDPVINYLVAHEREVLLPFVSFDRMSIVLAMASSAVGPALERFVPEQDAREIVEWAARLIFSQFINPEKLSLEDAEVVIDLWNMTNFNRFAGLPPNETPGRLPNQPTNRAYGSKRGQK